MEQATATEQFVGICGLPVEEASHCDLSAAGNGFQASVIVALRLVDGGETLTEQTLSVLDATFLEAYNTGNDALYKNPCSAQYRHALSIFADRSVLERLRRLAVGDSLKEITFQVERRCLSPVYGTPDPDAVIDYVGNIITAVPFVEYMCFHSIRQSPIFRQVSQLPSRARILQVNQPNFRLYFHPYFRLYFHPDFRLHFHLGFHQKSRLDFRPNPHRSSRHHLHVRCPPLLSLLHL